MKVKEKDRKNHQRNDQEVSYILPKLIINQTIERNQTPIFVGSTSQSKYQGNKTCRHSYIRSETSFNFQVSLNHDFCSASYFFDHRLYRQHCIVVNKSYYLKNLNILGRNTRDVIIVDDNNIAGILQPENFYRIEPFQGNDKDRQLCRLSAFLKHIHNEKKYTSNQRTKKTFEEMEIKLQEEVISQFKPKSHEARSLSQRKKQYRHKKTNSEVQALVVSNCQAQTEVETTASNLMKKLQKVISSDNFILVDFSKLLNDLFQARQTQP